MPCLSTDHEMMGTKFCPDCGERLRPDVIRIDCLHQLQEVASMLGVRPDWHEPDEQEVSAKFDGHCFDNAGFWPSSEVSKSIAENEGSEMCVILKKAGQPVAMINLATLFAIACRTYE